jgi:hypothetical protein
MSVGRICIVRLDDILALLAEEFSLIGGLLARATPHQAQRRGRRRTDVSERRTSAG